MQWWLWIVIWVALVVLLVATVAYFGWRLVKKGLTIVEELEALNEKIALLQDNVEKLTPAAPRNAILDGYPAVADRRDDEHARRSHAKELRRDARMQRGRLLIDPLAWKGRTDAR
ncbi:hypothetical protein [Agreia sp. COWG]|uniref:hypothetical protein n=1 Tax=Agreia sp. COWG TaxID=2773266 RepID=UPI001927BE00|nr:hypothetical protein [Agreia sp. COWG]CAD5997796.1 conserved protein of unknown function [Agreia sp. COWG]